MLRSTFEKMNCDIVGLQEISFLDFNQLNDLNKKSFEENEQNDNLQLSKINFNYNQYCCQSQINIKNVFPNYDKEFKIDGNAVMSSNYLEKGENDVLFLDDHKILHLSAERVAQMLIYKFHKSEMRIIFVNCHLHHTIEDEQIRLYQSKNINNWINLISNSNDLILVVGDFNALPNGLAYNYFLENNYVSAHLEFHKNEPEKTFHNKMDAPFKDSDPEGTFDYIL